MPDVVMRYENGQDATRRAEATAWARLPTARAVILVEGVSDQIAVEQTAAARGRDLATERVVVLPIGGAHAIRRALERVHDRVDGLLIAGLCDAAEEPYVRRAVTAAGLGDAVDRSALERLGFFVCVDDLEDELVRAAGPELIDRVMLSNGDRSAFRTLRAQPTWRDATYDAQIRRFIGAGARRKHRYAATLVQALGPARSPAPLAGLLDHVTR